MICASVSSSSIGDMLSRARAAVSRGAECVEFRIDGLGSPTIGDVLSLDLPDAEKIATFKGESLRLLQEGGLEKVLEHFDRVDIGRCDADRLNVPAALRERLILSYHGEVASEEEAADIMRFGLGRAGVVKCVNTLAGYGVSMHPCRAADSLPGSAGRIIAFSQGEDGVLSRIRSLKSGSPVSYACADPDERTATGQLTVEEMLSAREGMLLGIAGSPAAVLHSLSPSIHTNLLMENGMAGVYLRLPVGGNELPRFFGAARYVGMQGFNVTMPFKREALAQADSIDTVAEEVGAVNTICCMNGSFRGFNTDALAVGEMVEGLAARSALIFGSGGAARAAAFALRGLDVSIASRNREERTNLARDFGLEQYEGRAEDFDVLVNCTPAGMDGVDVDIPSTIRDGSFRTVIDFVYSAGRTPFMDIASSGRAVYKGGREVLARQAVHSFRLWTGVKADAQHVVALLAGEVGHVV